MAVETDVNLDELSDEEFLAAIDDDDSSKRPAAEEPSDDEPQEEVINDSEDTDQDGDSNSPDPEDETNDPIDDDDQETSDGNESNEEPDLEENTHSNEDESAGDSIDDDSESTKEGETEAGSEDETDTNDDDDGQTQDTDELDYKSKYEELKSFYDEITSEFKANGKTVKGFNDPKKIIQSQQMAMGLSEKMAALKQYRPFMEPLRERGMLNDTSKFDLAMQLLDGDVDALKKHMKDLNIDPFELDMDNVNYQQKKTTASNLDIAIDDLFENAQTHGIDKELKTALESDWDKDSVLDILSNPAIGEDLIDHIESGAYNAVQDRIAEKQRYDRSFSRMSSLQQYQEAAAELKTEYDAYLVEEAQRMKADEVKHKAESKNNSRSKVNSEKAKIEKKRKDEAYKEKVAEQKRQIEEKRKKAASLSKSNKSRPKTVTKFDPDKLSDEEFAAWTDGFIT